MEEYERIRDIVEADPILSNRDRPFLGHKQAYRRGVEKLHRMQQLRTQMKLSEAQFDVMKECLGDEYPTIVRSIENKTYFPLTAFYSSLVMTLLCYVVWLLCGRYTILSL